MFLDQELILKLVATFKIALNLKQPKYLFHGAGFDIFAFFLDRLVRLLQLLVHPVHLVPEWLCLGENLYCKKTLK